MKKILLFLVLLIAAAFGLVFAYLEMRQERDREAVAEAPIVAPSRAARDAQGATVLKLDAATRERLGLQTAALAPGTATGQIAAAARVLDGATLAAAVNELRAAHASLNAARADHERKARLFEQGRNASASAVEQAAALVQQHQIALETGRDRLAAIWGNLIASRDDLPEFAGRLVRREIGLVRIELLATDRLDVPPANASLFHPSGEPVGEGRMVGPAPATDSVLAGHAFLALVPTNAGALVPGSALLARLPTGTVTRGLVVPAQAVVRHAGQAWVYVELAADTFARRPVPVDQPHPDGWLVPGDWPRPLVTHGAQSLLSEELKGSIQMRD